MLQIHEIRPAFISRSRRHCTATVWSRASKTLAKCVVIRLHTELLTSQDVYTIRFADIALKKKNYQKQKCNFFIHFSKLIALLRLVPSSYIQSSFCFFVVVFCLFFYLILLLGLLERHPQSNCPGDTQQSLKLLISISFGFIEVYKIHILIRETEV